MDEQEKKLKIEFFIHLTENSFAKNSLELNQRENFVNRAVREVINWIYPGSTSKGLHKKKGDVLEENESVFDPKQFYDKIQSTGEEKLLEKNPEALKIELRNYQKRAVQWMLDREHSEELRIVNPFWKKLNGNAIEFYYNQYTGDLFKSADGNPPEIKFEVSGGILADEMGLGKTIEVLSCVLLHQNTEFEEKFEQYKQNLKAFLQKHQASHPEIMNNQEIYCYCCNSLKVQTITQIGSSERGLYKKCMYCGFWQHKSCIGENQIEDQVELENEIYLCPDCNYIYPEKIPSKATLIICPSTILQQWRHEIMNRTKGDELKVLIYQGVSECNRNIQLGGGIKVDKNSTIIKPLLPMHLLHYDIIITTYDVLRSDLTYAVNIQPRNDNTRMTRNKKLNNNRKKYRILPTPLISIEYWRVCLDEAQMVGSSTAKSATMALKLRSHYKWCISGTPIQRKGLLDLRGLFLFLNIPLLSDKYWFNKYIVHPFTLPDHESCLSNLVSLCKSIIWRSYKLLVANEINIPSQSYELSLLKFSPIESHFYKKQHQICSEATIQFIRKSEENSRPFTQKQVSQLLFSLIKLRQACCHPQIGNQQLFGLHIQKTPLSMEQLLDQFILKSKIECEESQRQWICSACAIAAIEIIKATKYNQAVNAVTAAKFYREVFSVVNENEHYFETDLLQKLHIYYNLACLLGYMAETDYANEDGNPLLNPNQALQGSELGLDLSRLLNSDDEEFNKDIGKFKNEINKTLGYGLVDDQLLYNINQLKMTYMEKNVSAVVLAKEKFVQASKKVDESIEKFTQLDSKFKQEIQSYNFKNVKNWWNILFDCEEIAKNKDQFTGHIKDQLQQIRNSEKYMKHPLCLANRFWSLKQLSNVLRLEINQLHNIRNDYLALLSENQPATGNINKLKDQLINLTNCPCKLKGFSNVNKYNKHCPSCQTFLLFVKFEKNLYFDNTSLAEVNTENSLNSGDGLLRAKHDNDLIIVINTISKYLTTLINNTTGKRAQLFKSMKNLIDAELNILKKFKKEFKLARLLWESEKNQFLGYDELNQATLRIRLRLPREKVDENLEGHYKIQEHQIPTLEQKYKNDKIVHETEMLKRKGQLKYLLNLFKNNKKSCEGGGTGPSEGGGECVICCEPMIEQVVILSCGHEYCAECVTSLIIQSKSGTIKCPNCRTRMNADEVAYVSFAQHTTSSDCATSKQESTEIMEIDNPREERLKEPAEQDEQAPHDAEQAIVKINGSWGTKIEAIIMRLLDIKKMEPDAKALIFSQWVDVLDIIHEALNQNNIKASNLASSNRKTQQQIINSFRFLPSISVLLLPIKKGANGLNLIEANHVFFVEPLLNPAAEAQAIGRIHRIGQIKPTKVHRFIIENTIEQKIYQTFHPDDEKVLSSDSMADGWQANIADKDLISLDSLKNLFYDPSAVEDKRESISDAPVPTEDEGNFLPTAQPAIRNFWNKKVIFQGKMVTRYYAAKQLDLQYSYDSISTGKNANSPVLCNLYSVKLPNTVARRLMQLKEAKEGQTVAIEEDSIGISDLL